MNIYVANLNFSTTSESLQDLFAEYGEVTSAKIITDRESGRSRGFGFVEMSDDTEGNSAISDLHEADFEGKTLQVSVARPRVERSNNGYGNRNGYGNNGYGNRGGDNGYNRNRY